MIVRVSTDFIFMIEEESGGDSLVHPIKGSTLIRDTFEVADWYRQQSCYFKNDLSKPTKRELDEYTRLYEQRLKFAEESVLACMSEKFIALFEGELLENGVIRLERGSELIIEKEDDSDVDDYLHVMSLIEVSDELREMYKNDVTI